MTRSSVTSKSWRKPHICELNQWKKRKDPCECENPKDLRQLESKTERSGVSDDFERSLDHGNAASLLRYLKSRQIKHERDQRVLTKKMMKPGKKTKKEKVERTPIPFTNPSLHLSDVDTPTSRGRPTTLSLSCSQSLYSPQRRPQCHQQLQASMVDS